MRVNMPRGLLFLLLILLVPPGTPAFAAGEKKPAASGDTDVNLRLDLSGIGLPILREGRVVNFVFIRARIVLKPGMTRPDIEAREPFIREALVRSAYRSPLNAPNDFMAVDPKVFDAMLLREARAVFGAKNVSSATLRDQKAQKLVYAPPAGTGKSTPPIRP
jgi:hypothetical protein